MSEKNLSYKKPSLLILKVSAILLIGVILLYIESLKPKKHSPHLQTSSFQTSQIPPQVLKDLFQRPFKIYKDQVIPNASIFLHPKKYKLVGLWGSWCTTCQHEIPEIIHFHKEKAKDSLQLIFVNLDPALQEDQVIKIWNKMTKDHFLILDSEFLWSQAFNIEILPSYILIHPNSEIKLIIHGKTPWDSPKIQNQILSLLSFDTQ